MIYFNIFLFTLMVLAYRAQERNECEGGSSEGDYSRDALISVIPKNGVDKEYLRDLAKLKIIHLWNEMQLIIGEKNLMRVSRSDLKNLIKVFKKRNMKVIVVAHNLERLIKRNSGLSYGYSYSTKHARENDSQNFFDRYHTFENIELFLKDITTRHKDVSKLEIFGKSYEDRPMYAVKVSLNSKNLHSKSNREEKQIILVNCGIHAREWISISFCLFLINALITGWEGNKKEFKEVLDKYDFMIIPVMNPDGYTFSHKNARLWRKTRSPIPGHDGCFGADANRNFYSLGNCDDDDPCSQFFCGLKPFSEPEVAAFKVLLENTKGKLKAFFDVHAYGQYWLFPWARCKIEKPKHYDELIRVAQIGQKAIEKRYNTNYTLGMASEVLYECKGIGIDYVYEKEYAMYSFALELRDKGTCTNGKCGFFLPLNKIIPTCEETADGIMAAVSAMK